MAVSLAGQSRMETRVSFLGRACVLLQPCFLAEVEEFLALFIIYSLAG